MIQTSNTKILQALYFGLDKKYLKSKYFQLIFNQEESIGSKCQYSE